MQPQPPSRFATYDKTVTEAGKKDTSTWSKIGGFLKRTAVAGLDWVNEQRREREISNFKMRQMMYSDRNDPMRFVVGEDGKKKMTNNALEAFEAAQTDEEKMAIIAEDTKEIPLIRAINSDIGKKITGTVSDKTENLPIKTLARFIAIGDSTYEEARDAMIASADATIADEETSRWKKWLLQVEKGGAQSLLGVVLSVGSSLATRNATVGTAVGTGYFGALSIEEERQKYEGGNIDRTSALGNIAIDTIGDQVLGGLAESTLKSLATDAGKSWLKNYATQYVKGHIVEGSTESAQSLLKYANDYTAARTDADREAIAASFSEYIKSGGIVDEFMVGGITGGIVNTLATAAGGAARPYVNVKGENLEPEKVAETKDKIEEAVDKALDSGDLSTVVETVQNELGASDDTATRIVQEVAQDIVAENANREAPVGSPEYVALQQDITSMVESGINPADISISMQEQLNVSEDYATKIVADALARIETKVESGNQKLDALTEETRQQTQRYAYIANKLNELGVQVEENDPVVLALRVAISGKGTAQEKEAAINLLADPANEDSRAVYEEEMGAILPTDRNEAVEYLRARINKSKERVYAEQMVQFQLDRAEAGRRERYGEHDATKENGGITFVGIKSTFPEYIPEELRKRELLDKVQPYLDKGQRPKETEKQNRLARLYDAIQNQIDVQEARLMSEEVIVTTQTTPEGADIPFQLAHEQIMSESQISMEEAEQIIRRYFTAQEVPLAFVKSIRTPRGLEAWGKYAQGVITLVENPKADTPHHESVHAFLDLFVAEQDRQRYLDAAYEDAVDRLGKDKVDAEMQKLSKRYKDQLTDARVKAIYAEEALADGFYEYLQGREVRSTLKKLYDMIVDFIQSMRGEMTARKLYEDIIARKRDTQKSMAELRKGGDYFSMGNRIHPQDREVMVDFIDHARIGKDISDVRFEMAERLALKWGINLDKGLKAVANDFEKVLTDVKRVTGTILYSEKEDTLLNVHNLTVQNLLFSNEFGGIVNPSIATIDLSKQGFDNYGEITLVGDKDLLDLGKTYRADAYSPRFPRFEYPATYKQIEKIKADLNAENQAFAGEDVRIDEDNTYDQLLRTPAMVKRFVDANNIDVGIVEGFSDSTNEGKAIAYSFQVNATAEQLYDFGVYVRDYLDGFGITPQIYNGRTPMGRPKYIPATRENVLKVMKKPDRGGETFNYGLGTIRAKLTPTLPKSQVAKNKDKIVTTEQFEKVRDEMQNKFFALAEEFQKYSKYKSDRLDMSSYDGLSDYLAGTWNGFLNNYENVPQSLLDEVQKFKSDIREMPTEYFETKAKGVIDFGEFKYAIVPNNVSPRVTEILKRKGVQVLMYDAKKEEERTKVMASLGDVLFQEDASNDQVVFAYGKSYLNFNLEFMVEKANEKGVNLFKLLVDRVDSQSNTPNKIAALQNILNHLTTGEALLPVRRTSKKTEEPIEVVMTKTNATTAFKNIEIEGVPRATKANTETHEYVLGKDKIKIEDAELKKYRGEQNGVYVDGYAIFVKRDGKDFVAHVETDLETASKWLADHAGKTVTVPKRATSNVLVSGRIAHAVVTNKDLIELEANHIAGAKGITDFVFYDAQGNEIEKKVVYDKPQYVKATPELVSEATANKKVITFPRYFAVVNRKLVQVTDDVTPATPSLLDQEAATVDETRVTRVEQEQPTQKPVKPTLVEKPKTKASKAFERAKNRLAEEYQEDLSYTRIRIDDQMAKAFELVDTNPAYAKAVALGLEQPPLDITDTAISLAVAERAKDEKNYALQADVEKARSLRQTRRGQEIVLERGRVDENSPEFFVRELIKRRKQLAEMKYKPVLTRIKPFMQMLDEKVAEKKKKGAAKVKSELEMKASELDAFLAEMAC